MISILCDGPRGRRVVLELIRDTLSEDMRRGLFELAYQADVAAGASVSRLTFTRAGETSPAMPPVPSLTEFAEAIRPGRAAATRRRGTGERGAGFGRRGPVLAGGRW